MKRAIHVASNVEGDALMRVLDVPALKAVQVITGMLLDLPHVDRVRVLQMVQSSLDLMKVQSDRADEHQRAFWPVDDAQDAGTSGE